MATRVGCLLGCLTGFDFNVALERMMEEIGFFEARGTDGGEVGINDHAEEL